jgi:sugar (pentulose or hexulose) kinase
MIGINIDNIVVEKNIVQPNPALAELYEKQYRRFLAIYPALQSIYSG